MRFFLTAPLFAAAAGLLLFALGEDVLVSRWTSGALAITHLLTIGFMLQAMAGALIQILPVVAGANLANPLRVARWVHAGLSIGGLGLAAGFLAGRPAGIEWSAIVLVATIGFFIVAAARALGGVPTTSPTIRGLKLVLPGLAVTAGIGGVLAWALGEGWPLPLAALVDLHAAWGLGAWVGILLISVSYVVVPMFQLTPAYSARLSWWLPVAMIAALLLWSSGVMSAVGLLSDIALVSLAVVGIAFAGTTLRLQSRRRRARPDTTYCYWRNGLWSSIAALSMLPLQLLVPELGALPAWAMVFGILLGLGGVMSFIAGMLYKIVPFLAWLHLQNAAQGRAGILAPNMNRILPEAGLKWQARAHFLAVALLCGAAIYPEWLARAAGLAFTVSSAWLAMRLLLALRFYGREWRSLAGDAPC